MSERLKTAEDQTLTPLFGDLNPQGPFSIFTDDEQIFPGVLTVTSRFGTLKVGKRPEGFDGWLFREPGGNSAVTVPWVRTPDGDILVGMILENRPNMGEKPVWCAIGGICEPEESHADAQEREALEEAGLETAKATLLPGLPSVNDRLYYLADANKDEGNHVYQLELAFEAIELAEVYRGAWKTKEHIIKTKGEAPLRFFPWKVATLITADEVMLAAILRLIVEVQ